jgi:hypothetical protein
VLASNAIVAPTLAGGLDAHAVVHPDPSTWFHMLPFQVHVSFR